jgi:hypothetical protein
VYLQSAKAYFAVWLPSECPSLRQTVAVDSSRSMHLLFRLRRGGTPAKFEPATLKRRPRHVPED